MYCAEGVGLHRLASSGYYSSVLLIGNSESDQPHHMKAPTVTKPKVQVENYRQYLLERTSMEA